MKIDLESLADGRGGDILKSFKEIIPSGVRESVDSLTDSAEAVGFPALVGEVLAPLTEHRGELGAFLLFMIGTVALMAAASLFSGRICAAAEYAVMLICGVAIFSRIYVAVSEITESIGGVLSFFTSFIPVISSAIAYGGGVSAAAAGASGANMTLGIIGKFLLPLMNSCASFIFALGLVSAAGGAGALAARVKNFFMWLSGLVSVLLLSSLALQSAIASASDTAAVRAAKYAASGAIPIVGGSVSSAMGALGAGASYIKSTVGAGGLAVILLLTLSPLALLLAYRFIISLGEGILDFLGVAFGARLLGAFRSALDVITAVFAMTVTVLIIEIALMMKSGAGAV